jgi:hypothetical protein
LFFLLPGKGCPALPGMQGGARLDIWREFVGFISFSQRIQRKKGFSDPAKVEIKVFKGRPHL